MAPTIPEVRLVQTGSEHAENDVGVALSQPRSVPDCYVTSWPSSTSELMTESECVDFVISNMELR